MLWKALTQSIHEEEKPRKQSLEGLGHDSQAVLERVRRQGGQGQKAESRHGGCRNDEPVFGGTALPGVLCQAQQVYQHPCNAVGEKAEDEPFPVLIRRPHGDGSALLDLMQHCGRERHEVCPVPCEGHLHVLCPAAEQPGLEGGFRITEAVALLDGDDGVIGGVPIRIFHRKAELRHAVECPDIRVNRVFQGPFPLAVPAGRTASPVTSDADCHVFVHVLGRLETLGFLLDEDADAAGFPSLRACAEAVRREDSAGGVPEDAEGGLHGLQAGLEDGIA